MKRTPEKDESLLTYAGDPAAVVVSEFSNEEPTPNGNDSTAEERAAEARDQMEELFRSVK